MTPMLPVMIAAFKTWMAENEQDLLHISVDYKDLPENVKKILEKFVDSYGRVRLSIGANATRNHFFGEEAMEYDAKFHGEPYHMIIPYIAITEFFVKTGNKETPEVMLPFPNLDRTMRAIDDFRKGSLRFESQPVILREPTDEELQQIEAQKEIPEASNEPLLNFPLPQAEAQSNVVDFLAYRARKNLKLVPGGKK